LLNRSPGANVEAIIRAEYDEMPGMRLTAAQAARLWSLPPDQCTHVLQNLVQAGFLAVDLLGRYGRRVDLRDGRSVEKRAPCVK
jgi:hypothetical protein